MGGRGLGKVIEIINLNQIVSELPMGKSKESDSEEERVYVFTMDSKGININQNIKLPLTRNVKPQ